MANKKLNALITIGGVVSGSLKGAFGSLKGNVTQIGGAVADLNRKQRALNQSINEYARQGVNVDRMRARYEENARQLTRLTEAQKRLNRVQAAGERNQARKDQLRGQIGETVASVVAVGYPIKAAMEFEDKMAEVRKVVDAPAGMDSKTYFGQLGKQILDLSEKIPMTASEIGDLVAAGGQSGIAGNELVAFAEAAGKMGVAFDISASEAGQKMAEMKSAFRMTLPEVIELGDKINALSNIGAASAADVTDIVQRIGPLGEVANVSSGQIAALGSTLRGMGVQNEIAATGIKNLMLTLTSGAKATKGQKEALAQLGLGSKQVAGSMQKDSRTTIISILKRIKMLDAVHQPEVLNALFGKEVVGSIAPLLNNLDELNRQFDLVGDKSKYAGSMQKEFESRAATTSNNLVLLRNRLNRIAISIGSAVLPQINQLVQASFPYIDQLSRLIEAHPKVTQGIIAVGAALVSLRVATLVGGFAFTTLNGYLIGIQRVLVGVRTGFTLATLGMRGFGLAFVATPIGALITAVVVAVAALGVAIWRNWDAIKAFTTGALGPLWEGLKPVREAFGNLWDMVKHLGADFGITGESVGKVVQWFKDLFTPVNYSKEALDKAGKAGEDFGKLLAAGINFALTPLTSLLNGMKWLDDNASSIMNKAQTFGHEEIKSGWKKVTNFLGFGDETPAATAPQGRPLPPVPVMAQQRGAGGGGYTDNSTTTIQAVQQPGESQRDFARRVVEENNKAKDQRKTALMTDNLAVP